MLIKYFQHFEQEAQTLKWPTDQWPLLLQSVLKGKTQEAYTALPVSECVDNGCVKNAILKHMSWYQKHIIKNSEIIMNKKVKLMQNSPTRKKSTLTDDIILGK